MIRFNDLARREVLQSAGILTATALAPLVSANAALAHQGHDHAPDSST